MSHEIESGLEGTSAPLIKPTRLEDTVEELVLEIVPPLKATPTRLDSLSDYALDSLDLARDAVGYAWELLRHGPLHRRRVEGEEGRSFTQYKVRTMKIGADKRVTESEHPIGLETSGKPKGFREDVLGRTANYMRKGYDELPQLWNIARRQMNPVGPRPLTPDEERNFPVHYNEKRKLIKPGLGGASYIFFDDPSPKERMIGDSKFVDLQLEHPISSQIIGSTIIAYKIITRKLKNH